MPPNLGTEVATATLADATSEVRQRKSLPAEADVADVQAAGTKISEIMDEVLNELVAEVEVLTEVLAEVLPGHM